MPEAQFSLGQTLDPCIDEIVSVLKELNWSAQKGVRYGIPYLRIKRTGFHHIIEFDCWEPHNLGISNIPTYVIPLAVWLLVLSFSTSPKAIRVLKRLR